MYLLCGDYFLLCLIPAINKYESVWHISYWTLKDEQCWLLNIHDGFRLLWTGYSEQDSLV